MAIFISATAATFSAPERAMHASAPPISAKRLAAGRKAWPVKRARWAQALGANPGGTLIPVPTGIGISPKEVVMVPRKWLEERSDLQRYTLFPRGGHFAPSEAPEQVIPEYREFFRGFR